jgi:3',5'-cyclic AMP phosphodiesterase CpdA
VAVAGTVYDDANGNGRRDEGEKGRGGVVVSDGVGVAVTGPDGSYRLPPAERPWVFVVTPGDRRAVGGWYRPRAERVDFPLAHDAGPASWRFAQLSDPHVDAANVGRLRRALALASGRDPAFALVSGDLVRDAGQADAASARAQYALYAGELARVPFPVLSVIGNHDLFGLGRPGVSRADPAYGRGLYEQTLGPRAYAFNRGRIHFLVLDTQGIDEQGRYYGVLDAEELEWARKELAELPPGAVVVTVGHIPLRTGTLSLRYDAEGPARTLLDVDGVTSYRHVVRNTEALAPLLAPFRWTLALQGHTHLGERLRLQDGRGTRFHTAPAVGREAWAPWPAGIVVYTVRGEDVDDGEVLALDGEGDGSIGGGHR